MSTDSTVPYELSMSDSDHFDREKNHKKSKKKSKKVVKGLPPKKRWKNGENYYYCF